MNNKLLITLLILVSLKGYSQFEGDLFIFNYTLAPIGNDNIDYYNTDFKVNIPVKLKKGMLLNSMGLDYFQMGYKQTTFNTEYINQYYNISYELMYLHPINHKWELSTKVGLSITSNLANSLTSEDLLFNGEITAITKAGTKEAPSRFTFGVGYATFFGRPRVLPLLSYTKKVSETFSYQIGFPNTYATYTINERNAVKATIASNGFYANLSNSIGVTLTKQANKASYNSILLGLDYNYRLDNTWLLTFNAGYSVSNTYRLLDQNNGTVNDFELTPSPSFSTGIKYNLKNKLKNRNNEQ